MPFIPTSQNPSAHDCGRFSVPGRRNIRQSWEPLNLTKDTVAWDVQVPLLTPAPSNGVTATCNWDSENRNRFDENGNLILISRGVG